MVSPEIDFSWGGARRPFGLVDWVDEGPHPDPLPLRYRSASEGDEVIASWSLLVSRRGSR